jgi:hypothetical protein
MSKKKEKIEIIGTGKDSSDLWKQCFFIYTDPTLHPDLLTGEKILLSREGEELSTRPLKGYVAKLEDKIRIRDKFHYFRLLDLPIESSTFDLNFNQNNLQPPLTPELLEHTILPIISSLCEIQKILNTESECQPRIVAISQSSPVKTSIQGIPDAYKVLRDDIVPWRRKYQKEMSDLEKQEKQVDIEKKKAEVMESSARTEKEIAEAAKIRAESQKLEAEAAQLRFQLKKEQIEFVYTLVEKLSPDADKVERLTLFTQLLPQVETLALTNPEIDITDSQESDKK